MKIVPRHYQAACVQWVEKKLDAGERYLSVAMSVGTGKTATSLILADRLSARRTAVAEKVKIAMVFRQRMAREQAEDTALKLGVENIDFHNVRRFIESTEEYKFVILHDLGAAERRQVQSRLTGTETRAISFFSIGQEISYGSAARQTSPMIDKIQSEAGADPVVCAYATKEVLDVRDARYAGREELDYLADRIILDVDQSVITVNEFRNRIAEENNRKKRLQYYLDSIEKMKDKQKIDEQAAEIERLKAELREKEAMIAQQEQMLEFTNTIFSGFGIDAKVIQDSFARIQEARESLKADLESAEEDVREAALKQLQDMTAEIVSGLTQSALSSGDMEYFEEYLKAELTEEVWQKMDSKSRAFLITAKSTYEGMIKMKDSEDFDYSGVCLLVTKALEVEATKRFFHLYKEYLSQKYDTVSDWPYALRQRDRGGITEIAIEDSDFTLGSVIQVMGFKRRHDRDGNITGYEIAYPPAKKEFLSYARTGLFKFSERKKVEAEIKKDYLFIEKVRLDYRNPSAHRDRLTRTSAQKCMEYVIDVHHMLREMLITMKI